MAIAIAAGAIFFGGSTLLSPPNALDAGRPAVAAERTSLLLPGATRNLDATIGSLKAQVAVAGPNLARDHAALALAYLQKAREEAEPSFYDLAEAAIDASFGSEPAENFDATIARAILAGSRHDFHGQLRWARRATEIESFDSQAWGVMGDAQSELGDRAGAARSYQRSIDLRPDLASFGRLSATAAAAGDNRAAIVAMKRALGFAGTSPENAAWAHWQLGELYIGAGRFELADKHLQTALKLVPGYGSALESTAHLAAATGDTRGAVEIMTAVVEDYPLPGNFAFLGELHLLENDETRASEAFAVADRRLDEYLRHGVRPDVDFITFWTDRGIHRERALRSARSLYRERSSGAVADALAWALYGNRRFERAAALADEASKRSPGDAGFEYHRGMIARALGDEDAARSHLREALELDPSWSIIGSERARRILAEL